MKIGFVSLPVVGHLNPMTALARRLQSRGHEIVFIGVPDVESLVRAAGLNFVPYCENEYPAGSVADVFAPVSQLHGMAVVQYTCEHTFPGFIRAAFEHLGVKLAELKVDALVIDTIHFYLELIPMSMGIPYIHIWNILHMDLSGSTPPCFFSWPHEVTAEGLARNAAGVDVARGLFAPIVAAAMPYGKKMGLQIDWNNPASTISKLAVISQTPREFDFSGIPWPAQFHYTGPFHDNDGREPLAFPWDKLNGNPLVYVSMGTLVNGMVNVYKSVLQAVKQLPEIQVVLSTGQNVEPQSLGTIPSNVIIVRAAPQIELLKRAALCITHAGLNTALESLAQGVPMVAIPIGYDQPGVAARIAHHGVGEFVDVEDATAERVRGLVEKVLNSRSYREKARWLQKVIAQTRGLDLAADVIERAFQMRVNAQSMAEIERKSAWELSTSSVTPMDSKSQPSASPQVR